MIGRIFLVFLISSLIWLIYRLLNQWMLSRRNHLALQLEGFELGIPAILYFSSVDCQPCNTIQRPVLSKLMADLEKHLQLIEIDVVEQPELSSLWGVMSLPTTYLLDSKGIPKQVNRGLINAERLRKQLEAIW